MFKKLKNKKFNKWVISIRDKHPHYYKMFNVYYKQGTPLKILQELYDFLIENKNLLYILPKNLSTYNTYDELNGDLYVIDEYNSYYYSELQDAGFPKKIWNSLSKDDKKKLFYMDNIPSKLGRYKNLVRFLNDNNIKYSFYDNDKLYEYTKNLLSNKNTKICYDKGGMIISRVNYKTFVKVTSKKWCIKHKDEWKDMVKKTNKQYVVIDFNYVNTDDKHKFAFTVKKNGKVKYIFDMNNDEHDKKIAKKFLKMIK